MWKRWGVYAWIPAIIAGELWIRSRATAWVGGYQTIIPDWVAINAMQNRGLLLGWLGSGQDEPSRWIGVVGLVLLAVVLVLIHRLAPRSKRTKRGTALLCGGALANTVQRLYFGQVIDYLDIRPFPIFNLADLAILIGMTYILLAVFAPAQPSSPKVNHVSCTF